MSKITEQVDKYYSDKIREFGATPKGVDWNSTESQELRFDVLSNIITQNSNFSLLDYGCGFGSMYDYYKTKFDNFTYHGFDISNEMINEATKNFKDDKKVSWTTTTPESKFDYVIASGIFNVKLENTYKDWTDYVLETINLLDKLSTKGFCFNVLTSYSDKEFMKAYLYYADPLYLFDYCKKNFSKNVSLLHDYDLYEFSILVRK